MSPDYIQKWVEYLNDIDPEMAKLACEKLALANDPVVVEELIKALRNRPLDVRAAAARSLGKIGNHAAVPALVKALKDPDSMMSSAAADALGAIRDKSAVPALSEILHKYRTGMDRHHQLHGENRGLYMAAVYALQNIGTREAKAALNKYHRW
jgi:HEAT repeat protein